VTTPAGARTLAESRVLAIDVETTGFSPREGHALIEIAIVTIERGTLADAWSSLVKADRPIAAGVVDGHGIDDAMLHDAPDAAEVARRFRDRCDDHPLVFHNAGFDLGFLRPFLRGAHAAPLTAPVIDTVGLARGLLGPGANSLGALSEALGIPAEVRHRAEGDARTTARLLLALAPRWERAHGVRTVAELAATSQDLVRLGSWRIPGFAIDRDAVERAAALPRGPAAG